MHLHELGRLLYQIKLADQKVASAFERKTGFSLTRYALLMTLQEKGVCAQRTIKQELNIDQAAITRHLKILENKGYVIRERNPQNNREVFVELTEQAVLALSQCEQEHAFSEHPIYSALSKQEMNHLAKLLNKLNHFDNEELTYDR
ncbi:DNA-binding transcriptional regulator, MarR family [Amphibacillus marinus]|uniref:DNA-binding transcriptional regulator, MarR family n=1 Tax=Amphibacillus marinus TaxID=872970 RepID=A0A1H8LD36_9BACI|nr:MarR family transcriptional regulator [Amphibacillus marinus]SEO02658.1 DNA-binding transcriptional regulator, MarR family [Amphibacillus marinus]